MGEPARREQTRRGTSVVSVVTAWIRSWRDRRRLKRSGLFDPDFYRSAHGLAPSVDVEAHFLTAGARRGLAAHPLFDTGWYLEQNPDVARSGANPVLHYLLAGAGEGRDPNPFFSSRWYLTAYPEIAADGANPLAHYIRHGAREGRRPSPRFDPVFYLRQLPKDGSPEAAPLEHFLTEGRKAGLRGTPEMLSTDGEPVEWAEISTVIPWNGTVGAEIALFVTHAPGGRLKPHVRRRLDALRAEGLQVILLVASNTALANAPQAGVLAGLYVRENTGYDFAAWAHLLKLEPRLWDADALLLVNDSLIGPNDPAAHSEIFARARASAADVVALTESRERGWHLQSYFLWLKSAALGNPRLQAFFVGVRTLTEKQAVINRYEVAFASHAAAAGLKTQALFRPGAQNNPTVFAWRELLDEGFPFVKASVLLDRHADVGLVTAGWRNTLQTYGFAVADAEALLALSPDHAPALPQRRAGPVAPWKPERIAFHGPWNYANGLGAASRGYLSALWRLGAPLNLHGLKRPFHIHRRLTPGWDVRDFVQAPDAAIVHLNPDGWHLLTPEERREIDRARVRIGIWVWEMSHIPDFFRPNLNEVDVVWTPSRYCADVFGAELDKPVHVVPHVVSPPPELRRDKETRTVLYVFDGASYLARKNPSALVSAFRLSGLAARGWRLVLKTKHLMDDPVAGAELIAACDGPDGVTLMNRPVTATEMAELFAEAAIYASPHAAEGFGLTIAEAMAAGKRVLATDYSGPRDLLDPTCGWPVAYDEVELDRDYGHYRRGGRWARVRIDALAQALVEAADSFDLGDLTRADHARKIIGERLSAETVAAAMRDSFAKLESFEAARPGPGA